MINCDSRSNNSHGRDFNYYSNSYSYLNVINKVFYCVIYVPVLISLANRKISYTGNVIENQQIIHTYGSGLVNVRTTFGSSG